MKGSTNKPVNNERLILRGEREECKERKKNCEQLMRRLYTSRFTILLWTGMDKIGNPI